jgi:phosphate transport system protein
METHFEMEIEALRQKLLSMARQTEGIVRQSVEALLKRDVELAARVVAGDDAIDEIEVEVDEAAVLLLTKAPLATDLRFMPVAMKCSQNLERIGDEATKIAKRTQDLAEEPPLEPQPDAQGMAEAALGMLRAAIGALERRDPAAARAVIPRDKEVDALNRGIRAALVLEMQEHPNTVSRCLHWITAVKSLERIADHSKNIAEEVVYLCEAQDIRHMQKM